MKKVSLILIGVLMIALLFVSNSTVLGQPNDSGAIKCDLDITYNGAFWSGTVSGDECSVEGAIRFDAVGDEYRYRPNQENVSTMHFVEEFTMWPGSDEMAGDVWIKGKNCGVWNFSTFKYRAHGWVTDASVEWADLIGSQYHEMGTTSNPADGLPILAPGGNMKLVPSNRPVGSPEDLCAPPEN